MPPRRAPPAERDQSVVAAQFRTYAPPVFTGEEGPLAVGDWIRKMDRIFRMMGISDQHMVSCAEFQIEGAAGDWWDDYWRLRTADDRDQLTWDQLKGILETKYYPRHFRERMEREFYDLLQGDRSVEEYEREFARKSTFARHLVDTYDKKASLFRNGLTRDLRVLVANHGYLTYAETVERAQQIEASQLLDTPAQPLAQVAPLARQPAAVQPALPAPPQQAQHRNKRKWRGRDDRRNRRPGAPAQAAPPVPQPPAICATCQRAHRG
ncbi:Unknown protein, partial [Striga hermonthica]